MNKLLLYSLSLSFLAQAGKITKKEPISVCPNPNVSSLCKTNEGFAKLKVENEYHQIDDYKMHSVLHKPDHTSNNFEHYEKQNRATVIAQAPMDGAQRVAAGFWLSKFAVHALAQTAYALAAGAASLVYPPAAPIVYCSLQLTFAALVEIASTIVANKTVASGDARAL